MFQLRGIFLENPNTLETTCNPYDSCFIALTEDEVDHMPLNKAYVQSENDGGEYRIKFNPTHVSERLPNLSSVWATPVGDIDVHVLMGTHARLGLDSPLFLLDGDLIKRILDLAKNTIYDETPAHILCKLVMLRS